jgi:Leucine-rich repeat (LRR) protein
MSDLERLLLYDPLKMMKYKDDNENPEKTILKLGKKFYMHQPDKLINYLYSIDWTNPTDVAEAYQALKTWTPLKPV